MNGPVEHTRLLIIGAGPFGLAMAAQAGEQGIDHIVLGQPMSFWKQHMPAGMVLRSGCEWHLDPTGRDTFERFLAPRGHKPADVEPLPLGLYLEYAEWFRDTRGIQPRERHVRRLDGNGRFRATLDDGSLLEADRVLVATGFAPFAHVPAELSRLLPEGRYTHTRDCVDPSAYRGRRVLIVGGRQSALETAVLLAEAGAEAVHVAHRHETPAFTESDWSFVAPLLDRITEDPGWYRALDQPERDQLNARFWEQGRLKLEPWLGPRVERPAITLHPGTSVAGSEMRQDDVVLRLDSGRDVAVDEVILATGYKVDMSRLGFLRAGNLFERIALEEGSPVLDTAMQTTVPGLFITSLPAARSFGLFFAFTAAVRASARIVSRVIGNG